MKRFKFITENFYIKVIAGIFTAVIYLLVRRDVIKEIQITIPVAIKDVPKGKIFIGDLPPNGVTARIKGPWSKLLKMYETKPPHFDVSLGNLNDGDVFRFMPLELEQLIKIRGLKVSSIEPSELNVKFDSLKRREVKVKPVFDGKVPSAYEVDFANIVISPSVVNVVGPSSSLDKLEEVKTVEININNLNKDLSLFVQIDIPEIPYIKFLESRVRVYVPIKEKVVKVEIENIPIYVKPCPKGYICEVFPPKFTARLIGKTSDLKSVTAEFLSSHVSIDKDALADDTGEFTNVKPIVEIAKASRPWAMTIVPPGFYVKIIGPAPPKVDRDIIEVSPEIKVSSEVKVSPEIK